jgi:hypothetical protein
MSDQSMAEAAGAAGKILSAPAAIGVVAGALGFLFAWPTNRREGFCRLVASGVCSHFFGPGVLATAEHFMSWIQPTDMAAGCYLVAGLPGWWVLAWAFKWLENRREEDAAQVAGEVIEAAKKAKDAL